MCWYLIGMESFVLLSVDVGQVGMTVRELILIKKSYTSFIEPLM